MGCRFGGLACIGEPKSARGGRPIACRASRAGAAKVGVKGKAAEGGSLRRGTITTRGLLQGRGRRQSLPLVQQSHPTRFVAGAGNLWHTSAHKGNPLFRRRAPAPSTVDPRGLLTIRAAPEGRQVVRRPLAINGRNTDQWNGGERHSWRNDLLVPWPVSARRNAHTVAEGDARWGVPRGAGRFASPSVKSRRGRGVHWHQDVLGATRRWREALRLPVEDSAGSVPLQSG